MSLWSSQRTDIKRIIEAFNQQAFELQRQRGKLIQRIHADPNYKEDALHALGMYGSDPAHYQYSASVSRLIAKVQSIETTLARLKEKSTELHLLIAPIECLPVEILVGIFEAGSLSEPKGRLPFPMLIASVSRRWRNIALTTPTIWANVHITANRGHPCEWLSLALLRSQDRLLDITLDFRTKHPPASRTVLGYMSMINPHLHRWRRFALITDHRDVILIVTESLANACSQSLHSLRLSLTGSGPAGNQEVSIPRLFANGVPGLQAVRFDSVVLPWRQPPLTGLSTLDIRWLWFRKLAYPQFQDLLSASPNITKLILRGKHVDLRPLNQYTPILLPSLRYLEVSGDNVCLLCSLLIPSALDTLTLANLDESEFRDFVGWLPYSGSRYSALQSLVLQNVATCSLSCGFITAFATITQLTIINSGADQFLQLLRAHQTDGCKQRDELAWPRLKKITMLDDTEYDKVYSMVTDRATHGASLDRLIVHTEFIHRYILTPLTQYVKIDSVTFLDRDP